MERIEYAFVRPPRGSLKIEEQKLSESQKSISIDGEATQRNINIRDPRRGVKHHTKQSRELGACSSGKQQTALPHLFVDLPIRVPCTIL